MRCDYGFRGGIRGEAGGEEDGRAEVYKFGVGSEATGEVRREEGGDCWGVFEEEGEYGGDVFGRGSEGGDGG